MSSPTQSEPICWICSKPCPLEECRVHAGGRPMYELCYVAALLHRNLGAEKETHSRSLMLLGRSCAPVKDFPVSNVPYNVPYLDHRQSRIGPRFPWSNRFPFLLRFQSQRRLASRLTFMAYSCKRLKLQSSPPIWPAQSLTGTRSPNACTDGPSGK
jgi:hypothetical protein